MLSASQSHIEGAASESKQTNRSFASTTGGFLAPLGLHKTWTFFTSFTGSLRISAGRMPWMNYLSLIYIVQLAAIVLSFSGSHDLAARIARFTLPSATGVFLENTVAQVALIITLVLLASVTVWILFELGVSRSIHKSRRFFFLSAILRLIAGPLLLPATQVLSVMFLFNTEECGDLGFISDSVTLRSPTHVGYMIASAVGLVVLSGLAVLSTLTHFNFAVSESSIFHMHLPTILGLFEPVYIVTIGVLGTTRVFGSEFLVHPAVAALAISAACLFIAIIIFSAPVYAHPIRWGLAVFSFVNASIVALIGFNLPYVFWVAPIISIPVTILACGARLYIAQARFSDCLTPPKVEVEVNPVAQRSILKTSAPVIPESVDIPAGRYTSMAVFQYLFAVVALRGLFQAVIKHDRERHEMLSIPDKHEARHMAKQELIGRIQVILQHLCAERFTSGRSRLILIQYALTVTANYETAIFEATRIPTMVERDVMTKLSLISVGMLVGLHTDADRIRRKQDCGLNAEALAALNHKQKKAREESALAKRSIHSFWKALDQPKPDVNDLLAISQEIYTHAGNADTLFIALIKSFPDRDNIIRTYADFQSSVMQDPAQSKLLYACADEIAQRRQHEDSSESEGSSRSGGSSNFTMTETNVLNVLRGVKGTRTSSSITKLRGSVQVLLVVLGAIFVLSAGLFQVRTYITDQLVNLTHSTCGTGASAIEGAFLAQFAQLEKDVPGSIVNHSYFETHADILTRLQSVTETFREFSTGVSTGVENVIVASLFPELYTLIHDDRTLANEYSPQTPVIVRQAATSILQFLTAIAVRFDRMWQGSATELDMQYILNNSATNFLNAALFSINEVKNALLFIGQVGIGIDVTALVVVILIILGLQFFLLRRAFNSVVFEQSQNINLFLHINRKVVEQMVRATAVKQKSRKKKSAPSTRRAITFSEPQGQAPGMGFNEQDDPEDPSSDDMSHSHQAEPEPEVYRDREERERGPRDDRDAEFDDIADDDVTSPRAFANIRERETMVPSGRHDIHVNDDSDDDIEGLDQGRGGDSRGSLGAEAEYVTTLENTIKGLQTTYVSRTKNLQMVWITLLALGGVAAALVGAMFVLLAYFTYLSPQTVAKYTAVGSVRNAMDSFTNLDDTQTWMTFTFAHTVDSSSYANYWAVTDNRLKADAITKLTEFGLSEEVQLNVASSKSLSDSIAYAEEVSQKIVLSGQPQLTTAAQCNNVGFNYNYSAETRFPSEIAAYTAQRDTSTFAHGMYTSLANDTTLTIDQRSLLARQVMADPVYWDGKDEIGTMMGTAKTELVDAAIKEIDATITTGSQLLVGVLATLGAFVGISVLLAALLSFALCFAVRLKSIDSERVRIQKLVFDVSDSDDRDEILADIHQRLSEGTDASDSDHPYSATSSGTSLNRSVASVSQALEGGPASRKPANRTSYTGPALCALSILALVVAIAVVGATSLVLEVLLSNAVNATTAAAVERHNMLGLTSSLFEAHRENLANVRLFSQFQQIKYAFAFSESIANTNQAETAAGIFTLLEERAADNGVPLAALNKVKEAHTMMVHLERVSIQLNLWAAGISESMVDNLHGYNYTIVDEADYERDLMDFPDRPHVYNSTDTDKALTPDEQNVISRFILFDEKFVFYKEQYQASLDTFNSQIATTLDSDVSSNQSLVFVYTIALFACAALLGAILICFFAAIIKIATPRPPSKMQIIKQRANMARTHRFYRIATLNLIVIAVLFGLLTSFSLFGYFITIEAETIRTSALRLIDYFAAVTALVPMVNEPALAKKYFLFFDWAHGAYAGRHDALVNANDPLLIMINLIRTGSGTLRASSGLTCSDCEYVKDMSMDEMSSLFATTIKMLDPYNGGDSCVAADGVTNVGFQIMRELEAPMTKALWSEFTDYYEFITLVSLVYRIANIPLVLFVIVVLLLSYRLVFRKIFLSLQSDESMVQGLLKMIPREGIGSKSLLTTYLKSEVNVEEE